MASTRAPIASPPFDKIFHVISRRRPCRHAGDAEMASAYYRGLLQNLDAITNFDW